MMLLHPEVQERVQEELARVVGDRDQVTMGDRARLPYLEATLNEVWRYCNVAPIGPPRAGKQHIHEYPVNALCLAPRGVQGIE